ncbi:MAG: GAF and ANTAR domain-containing protein [Desulfatibacillaceae bacterium]|nr:GAF and ANTAR domain-containing protein [Desulfatibacillaceae bacterium]
MNRAMSSTSDEHLKALINLSHAIASDIFLDDILKLVAFSVARATSMDICSLWLVDKAGGGRLKLAAAHAAGPDKAADKILAMGEKIALCAIDEKRPVIVKDISKDRRFGEGGPAGRPAIVSMASVPIPGDKDRPIGAINCFSRKAAHLSQKDIDLVASLAWQASKIIKEAERMVRASIIKIELESLKKIDRAQKIIMDKKKLADNMALQWIQQRSADTCTSLHEVAEAILLANDCEL